MAYTRKHTRKRKSSRRKQRGGADCDTINTNIIQTSLRDLFDTKIEFKMLSKDDCTYKIVATDSQKKSKETTVSLKKGVITPISLDNLQPNTVYTVDIQNTANKSLHTFLARTKKSIGLPLAPPQVVPVLPPVPVITPPNNAFLYEPYGDDWKKQITAYAKNTRITSKNRYNRLKKYNTNLKAKKGVNVTYNMGNNKQIQLDNRFENLFEQVYQAKVAAGTLKNNLDTRAGVVVKFADGFALYTDISGTLGFPKGKIDYVLQIPNDIASVEKETSKEAALRELKEETGFYIDGPQLKREVNRTILPGNYTIKTINEDRKIVSPKSGQYENAYYYIIELKEKHTDPGPPLTPITPHARKEGVSSYKLSGQFGKPGAAPKYNYFSIYAF
jgi:8-oxo-dGTP pyrophosphatase MutT (NUDIX family)